MSTSFRAGDYEFTFEQAGVSVAFRAGTITGRDMEKNDEEWIMQYLKDMGKWETVAKTIMNLAIDTGITDVNADIAKKYELDFDAKNYEIEFLEMNYAHFKGSIYFSREERLRRSGGDRYQEVRLPLEEILDQAKNVQKWRNLRRTLSLLLPSA